jgi:ribosomal-protein-alanine N-acetyltransferase
MLKVNFSPFPELTTTRLLLRKLDAADTEQFFKLRSNKEVMKHIGKVPMTTINEVRDFIKMINGLLESNSGITWAMALKEEPAKLIGTIGHWRIIKEHFRAEIGYMLLPEYWRKGLTKEALIKVLDYGFNELKLHSVEGHITPLNIGSTKVLESTGFKREALFKEDFFFNEKFEDTAIYSLLRRNFSGKAL